MFETGLHSELCCIMGGLKAEVMEQKNYITPGGFERLKKELYELKFRERPEITKTVAWAASNGDRSENGDYIYGKKKLREIDKRIEFLSKRIDACEIVDPLKIRAEHVSFGATVTFRDEDGNEKTYSIVGVDETNVAEGKISWKSPLGAALIRAKAKAGDWITFESPKGEQSVEVLQVCYQAL